jgi:Xaa-Pro aminopeptidase
MNAIEKLKSIMETTGIDIYVDKISDPHLNEFVDDYFNTVRDLTNFTGDTAGLIVTKKWTYLIVDSRFTIQAKKEVDHKYIKVLTIDGSKNSIQSKIKEFFAKDKKRSIYDSKVLFFDYEKFSINLARKIIDITKNAGGNVFGLDYFYFKNRSMKNIANLSEDKIYADTKEVFQNIRKINKIRKPKQRPSFNLAGNIVGESTKSKISKITKYMRKMHCDVFVLSKLAEISYITNKRGLDFPCDPLFYSYLIIDKSGKHKLYAMGSYQNFYKHLSAIKNKNIMIDYKSTNYKIYKILNDNGNKLIDSKGFVEEIKSIKTNNEILNEKKAMLIESAALTDVIYQLKHTNFSKTKMSELDVSNIIDKKRKYYSKKFGLKYLNNSFDTISAYNENAAMAHYKPEKNKSKILKNSGLLLIDTGANYLYGTTDTTRTISLGKTGKNEKKHFTLVLSAMLALSHYKFKLGTSSKKLDKVARSILTKHNMNYGHSTGHGIGFLSCVHEGPNSFSPISNYKIKEHQIFSVEPGYYLENKYGIRIENILLSAKTAPLHRSKNMLCFETLTFVPIDKDMVDKKYLTKKSIKLLNDYTISIILALKDFLPKKIINYIESQII